MSDSTDTQPTQETTAASPEVTEAAAPVAEPETTTPEEPKPAAEPAATEESKPEEDKDGSKEEEAPAEAASASAEVEAEEKPAEEGEAKEEPEPEPEPIEIPAGNGELVLVTGATGYLASHIVKQLHESGEFKVRGSVRSLEDNTKLEALKALLHDSEDNAVEFVEADLVKPDSWAEAVKGCDYVIHTASPFPITDPADESEVIDPARDGTLSVLKACVEAKSVKRVVITSSTAAIVSGRTLDKNASTEEMWADVDKSSSAYDKSKTFAEKAAWDYVKELPEDSPLELSVVNPGFIVGPPLMKMDGTSIEVIKKLMNREYSSLPKISFACSDVRDVALAHVRAMMIKQAAGKRHIVCGASSWLKDMANMMSQEFSSKGFNIPTTQVPYILVWFKSHFDNTIKRILPDIGKIYNYDTTRMRQVLQVEPRDVKVSLIEMGHAMINLEIVQKVEKPEKKPRKLTFRKKKEKKVDEDQEEKKDEPEKAASTSGSADNNSVPDATIEDVEVKVIDTAEAELEAAPAAEEEAKPEEPAPEPEAEVKVDEATSSEEVKVESAEADAAAVHSEEEIKKDEATTSDPESTKKKDKKSKKEKKEKSEKKKGLFSFSFKKSKKPHVEKKTEEDKSDEEAKPEETPAEAATGEETPADAAAGEQAPATSEDTPVEETKAELAPETTAEEPKVEETPAEEPKTEEAPIEEPKAQEAAAESATTEETTPVATEDSTETPATTD